MPWQLAHNSVLKSSRSQYYDCEDMVFQNDVFFFSGRISWQLELQIQLHSKTGKSAAWNTG